MVFEVDVAGLHVKVLEMKNHGIERAEISILPKEPGEQESAKA